MEVGIVLATASGGCAAICGGSPIIYRDSKRFSKSSYMLGFPHPKNDRCHFNIEKVTVDF
jgi:hypothetical protein